MKNIDFNTITAHAALNVLDSVVSSLARKVDESSARTIDQKTGTYNYYCSIRYLVDSLGILPEIFEELTKGKKTVKFLECGAGYGVIISLMRALYYKWLQDYSYTGSNDFLGLEWNDTILANKISGSNVVKRDIMKFEDYHKYNLIYFWLPFLEKNMKPFLDKLVKDCVAGTIIMSVGYQLEDAYKNKEFKFSPLRKLQSKSPRIFLYTLNK